MRATAWLTRLAAVVARSDWRGISAANRATHSRPTHDETERHPTSAAAYETTDYELPAFVLLPSQPIGEYAGFTFQNPFVAFAN